MKGVSRQIFLVVVASALVAGSRLRNSTSAATALRLATSAAKQNSSAHASCQCEANNLHWLPTTRVEPKCIFIDLGAANANTFHQFLNGDYGPIQDCPSGGKWEAYLVEANPQFTPELEAEKAKFPGQLQTFGGTAAYMCAGSTSFSIDPDGTNNHWGSSMVRSDLGGAVVTLPTVNIIQLIAEHTTKADWVMLKVDIEGAEFDILPCLAQYPNAGFIDRMYLEEHNFLQSASVYSQQDYAQAKQKLVSMGVDIPAYHSHTL